jgi:tetratricopeptide (TPR) repeat protein
MPASQGYQGHYCDGLRFLNRAYASMRNKGDMKYYLEVAVDNFNYMLLHTGEGDIRRGEFHLGKARALKLLGRKAEAATEFNKALSYKINSPDAYQELADQFHETGNKRKALEMATEGLSRYPNSKGLKRRYTEFGGKLPYPVVVEETVLAEETKPEVKTEAELGAGPSSEATTGKGPDVSSQTLPVGRMPQVEPDKIGSPKNPYCRFCPD